MSMHFVPGSLVVLIGVLIVIPARAGEDENWQRLRAIPREQRLVLADKIKEFDALPREQRDAIRGIDQQVNKSADRDRYLGVLRRYHLWLQNLPEAQREQFLTTPPDQRMALVTKFRAEERATATKTAPSLFLQIADHGGISLFDLGQRLKVWFALTPPLRSDADKLQSAEWGARMNQLGQQMKIEPEPRLAQFDDEAIFDRLKQKAQSRVALPFILKDLEGIKIAKARDFLKKDDHKKLVLKRRLIENYYYVEKPPEPVDGDNLFRFETALPHWIRKVYDHLPPEEARRRLMILYRLVYPAPEEMPLPKKPEAPKGEAGEPAAPKAAPPAAPKPGVTPL
jgi:hypothetical protein